MIEDAAERDSMLKDLYDELRAAAARMLRRDAPFLTLQPTELVNEAAMRIVRLDRMRWHNRQHFFATGSRILRQAMVDEIRRKRSAKRQAPTILLKEADGAGLDVEALDAALIKLESVSPDLAKLVEMRFFAGLAIAEIAMVTDSSESTVKRRWQTARLWLADELAVI